MLNNEQSIAVKEWKNGKNVKITAVPGAGKSKVLLEASQEYSDGIIIILAYNHDLCEETKKKITEANLEERVICLTFHGLATYCIMPAYDDTALFDAIEGVESGEIQVKNKIQVSGVLIDEAQDFRPSFYRLLKLVLDLKDNVQYMVVGDTNQMLYTYDAEDPADIKFLNDCSLYFQSSRLWHHVELFKTHRLTPPMANVVSKIFGINVVSAKDALDEYLPVQLYSINLWKSGAFILNLIKNVSLDDVCVLVPKKKNNGPLKAAVNYLSEKGVRIYLHGNDGQDSRIRRNKLCVGTWHSSKGTERKIVVVLGVSNESQKNPCFVAMTRAKHQLVIIQDEYNPYEPLMNALKNLDNKSIIFCQTTLQLKNFGYSAKVKNEFDIRKALTYSLEDYRPSGTGRWIRDYQIIESNRFVDNEDTDGSEEIVCISDLHENVSDIYTFACCMSVEYELTGKVRLLEDIRSPVRLTRERQDGAIIQGHNSRFISPNLPAQSLLGEDMNHILNVYTQGNIITPVQWCELACVARSWNDFHHTMRQLKPFDWFDVNKFYFGRNVLIEELKKEDNIEFDVRVKRYSPIYTSTMFHARVDAISVNTIYYLIWSSEILHSHKINASIRASLHDKPVVKIINLRNNNVMQIMVSDRDVFLQKLIV